MIDEVEGPSVFGSNLHRGIWAAASVKKGEGVGGRADTGQEHQHNCLSKLLHYNKIKVS